MHSNTNVAAFSENDECFSNSTADGIVYFWNCSNGQLRNEYKPSSHLSATCTCISWGPSKRTTISTPRKKKRKSNLNEEISDLELVAIGTENGTILLYSLVKEDLFSKLEVHSGPVNGVSWSLDEDKLYSCSSDKHIVEWNFSSSKKSKWKADDNEIHSVCYMSEGKLLSASSEIKLWNLEDKSVLQKFTGHAAEVWKILPVTGGLQNSGYFLSAALGDREIHAWQMQPQEVRKSLASYTLTDEPVFVDVSKPSSKEEPILLAVVTKSGELFVFEHLLNGRRNYPLRPKMTVKIASNSTYTSFLPIIGVRNCNDIDHNVIIVYGSVMRPRFEKLSLKSCQRKTILLREDHLVEAKAVIKVEEKSLKVIEPKTVNDVKVLGPAQMKPVKAVMESPIVSPRKSSSDKIVKDELSMSLNERLKAMELPGDVNGDKSEAPRADSFVHLLVQGLQSKDRRMLDTVLQRNDVELIQNTVKKLPLEHLAALMNEIQHHLYYKGEANLVYLIWLEVIMQTKLSIIFSVPSIKSQFEPLLELLNVRCDVFERVYKLKGRLSCMLSKITTETPEDLSKKEPLLKYQDSSSEEETDKEEDNEDDNDDLQIEGLMGKTDESDADSEDDDEDMDEGSESNSEDSEIDDDD